MTSLPASDLTPAALPRPIDFAYPSNRWAVVGLLGGVALARLRGRSWVGSVSTGLGGFAAWAIARELDPDHAECANVALSITLAASLLSVDQGHTDAAALGEVVAAFTALSSVRLLSGTVGQAANAGDQAALSVAAALCAATGGRAAALLPGAALALSSRHADDLSPHDAWSGPAALVVAMLPTIVPTRTGGRQPLPSAVIAGALLLAPHLLRPETVTSNTDEGKRLISSARVAQSLQLSLGSLALTALMGGTRSALPLAAAALSAGLRRRLKG